MGRIERDFFPELRAAQLELADSYADALMRELKGARQAEVGVFLQGQTPSDHIEVDWEAYWIVVDHDLRVDIYDVILRCSDFIATTIVRSKSYRSRRLPTSSS